MRYVGLVTAAILVALTGCGDDGPPAGDGGLVDAPVDGTPDTRGPDPVDARVGDGNTPDAGVDGATSDAAPSGSADAMFTGDVAMNGDTCGRAVIAGRQDHAGTLAVLDPGSYAAVTGSDGRFCFAGVPSGAYTLSLRNGPYQNRIPGVLAMPGTLLYIDQFDRGTTKALPTIDVGLGTPLARCFWNGLVSRDRDAVAATCPFPTGDAPPETFVVPLSGAAPRRLAAGEAIATNGRDVFVRDRGRRVIATVPFGGGTPVDVFTDAADDAVVTFSDDGATAILSHARAMASPLRAAPAAGGAASTIAPDAFYPPRLVAGGRLLYTTPAGLFTSKLTGGEPTKLGADLLATSPDRQLVLVATAGLVDVVRVDGTGRLAVGTRDGESRVAFTPGGDRVLWVEGAALRVVGVDGSGRAMLAVGAFDLLGAAGKYAVYRDARPGSSAVPLAGGMSIDAGRQGAIDPFSTFTPAPSPDGRWIAIASRTGLDVFDGETGTHKALASLFSPVTWTGDSRHVLQTGPEQALAAYRVADGTAVMQWQASSFALSPDQTRVLVTYSENGPGILARVFELASGKSTLIGPFQAGGWIDDLRIGYQARPWGLFVATVPRVP